MNKKLLSILAVSSIAGAASAQLTGVQFTAGYGWTGGIKDSGGVSRIMSGPELTATLPLEHLPMVTIGLEGDVLFGGGFGNSSIKGDVYRGFLTAGITLPGTQVGAWWGVGWATAQGSSGDFPSINGYVTQVGLTIPVGIHTPGLAPSLEVAGDLGSKSGLSGFSVSVALKF